MNNNQLQVGDPAFPSELKIFEKMSCTVTICLNKENVVEGSNVYMAESVEVINDKTNVVLESVVCPNTTDEKGIETSATHSPHKNPTIPVKQTQISIVRFNISVHFCQLLKPYTTFVVTQESNVHDKSPPTGNSSNKTRSRKSTETIDCDLQSAIPLGKRKSIKNEKYKVVA